MKKYLPILLLVIFIVPSIAFASWWNPISWFNGWKFNKVEKLSEVQEIKEENNEITEAIEEKEKYVNQTTDSAEIEKLKKEIEELKNKKIVNSLKQIQVSTIVPTNNLNTKDLCPNIEGIQSGIPSGKFLYRNTNECLTEEEINNKETTKKNENVEESSVENEHTSGYQETINKYVDKMISALKVKAGMKDDVLDSCVDPCNGNIVQKARDIDSKSRIKSADILFNNLNNEEKKQALTILRTNISAEIEKIDLDYYKEDLCSGYGATCHNSYDTNIYKHNAIEIFEIMSANIVIQLSKIF